MKGFRRVRAAEIKRSGSTLPTILGIGGWRGPGYRYYIHLNEDEEACTKDHISIIDNGIDTDDEDNVPPR